MFLAIVEAQKLVRIHPKLWYGPTIWRGSQDLARGPRWKLIHVASSRDKNADAYASICLEGCVDSPCKDCRGRSLMYESSWEQGLNRDPSVLIRFLKPARF
eukprot:4967799-Amphidinium_carterae.1